MGEISLSLIEEVRAMLPVIAAGYLDAGAVEMNGVLLCGSHQRAAP